MRVASYLLFPATLITLAVQVWNAKADEVKVVQKIPGYVCMDQNAVEATALDMSGFPPVYGGPSRDAPKTGVAAGVLIVADPLHIENGRRQVLRIDGSIAWIDTKVLKPWVGKTASAQCSPVLLSNNRRGILIR